MLRRQRYQSQNNNHYEVLLAHKKKKEETIHQFYKRPELRTIYIIYSLLFKKITGPPETVDTTTDARQYNNTTRGTTTGSPGGVHARERAKDESSRFGGISSLAQSHL